MDIDQELLNAHRWNVLILPPFDVPLNINMLAVSVSIEAIVWRALSREALQYTERANRTSQLKGHHLCP